MSPEELHERDIFGLILKLVDQSSGNCQYVNLAQVLLIISMSRPSFIVFTRGVIIIIILCYLCWTVSKVLFRPQTGGVS